MRLPLNIEVYLYRIKNNKIEYLILKRINSRGGFNQPITGGVEDSESLLNALKREIKEEAGIHKLLFITPCVHKFLLEDYSSFEFVYGAKIKNTDKIRLDVNPEHDEYTWCSFNCAIKKLKWNGNIVGLKKLNKYLKN